MMLFSFFSFLLDLPAHHLKRAVGNFVIACAVVFLLCVVGLIDKAPTVQNAVVDNT